MPCARESMTYYGASASWSFTGPRSCSEQKRTRSKSSTPFSSSGPSWWASLSSSGLSDDVPGLHSPSSSTPLVFTSDRQSPWICTALASSRLPSCYVRLPHRSPTSLSHCSPTSAHPQVCLTASLLHGLTTTHMNSVTPPAESPTATSWPVGLASNIRSTHSPINR